MPPPPAEAFTMSGKPILTAISVASSKFSITPLDPEPEKKEEDDDFPQSLEEALLGE